ncbi:MAG: endolytic transglycosylase MltG [Pseudonocardia sp.]|nr:endolytic transglycosylase MltG [Pseudonocardia sp.]
MDIDGPTARLRSVGVDVDGTADAGGRADAGGGSGSDADAQTAPLPVVGRRSAPARAPEPAPPRRRARPSGRRGGVLLLAVGVLLAAVLGGGYFLYSSWTAVPDFEGDGSGDVIVQVADGDSTAAIGRTLEDAGVVASVQAFLDAAEDEEGIRAVQPGSYQMRLQMSGDAAVTRLLDPAALVGRLEIRGGVQLDDTRGPDGTVTPGVLTLISEATCAVIDGAESCVSVDELRSAMAETDPAELGVPEWALDEVRAADPVRRLEGLFVPGVYDVEPGRSATEVLTALLAASTSRLAAFGLADKAEAIGSDPYQVLIIASLVEKEGITSDMPEVARVIYNRLAVGQRLELDSTVNYPLDIQALTTTEADRAAPGPYNTYATEGLPPTPIAAAGDAAIAAALDPAPGPWLYFVRCQDDGTSCFAETFAEHEANIARARENGAF